MKNKSKGIIAYLVFLAAIFIVGTILGYYIWGAERGEKPYYKAAEYLASLEKENTALPGQVASLQKEASSLSEQVQEGPENLNEQIKTPQFQGASLAKEKNELTSSLDAARRSSAHNKKLAAKNKELTEELESLKMKNASLTSLETVA